MSTLIMFILVCLCGLFQYGALLLAQSKVKIWRMGIYVGMASSGVSAFGFLLPSINAYPCMTFIVGTTFMLGCVLASYYTLPIPDTYTPEQRETALEQRHSTLRDLGIGLAFTLILAAVVGFTQGQQEGQQVQQGFAGVVYRLADEVKSLHVAVNKLSKQANVLQARSDSAVGERKRLLKNQEQMKQQLGRRK